MNRERLHRFVCEQLATNPSFRRHLSATAPDGTHPIIVALRSDPLSAVLKEIEERGGAGNLIVPWLNGVVAISMIRDEHSGDEQRHSVARSCTVGVFVARVREEGEGTYEFALNHDGHVDAGSAEMVAIAG